MFACLAYSAHAVVWENAIHACDPGSVPFIGNRMNAFEFTCPSENQTELVRMCEDASPIAPSLEHLLTSQLESPGFSRKVWTGIGDDLFFRDCTYGEGTEFPYAGVDCSLALHTLCYREAEPPPSESESTASPTPTPSDFTTFYEFAEALHRDEWIPCARIGSPCLSCGVECGENDTIMEMNLSGFGLRGVIPPHLTFTNLTVLDLTNNPGLVFDSECVQLDMCNPGGVQCFVDHPVCVYTESPSLSDGDDALPSTTIDDSSTNIAPVYGVLGGLGALAAVFVGYRNRKKVRTVSGQIFESGRESIRRISTPKDERTIKVPPGTIAVQQDDRENGAFMVATVADIEANHNRIEGKKSRDRVVTFITPHDQSQV